MPLNKTSEKSPLTSLPLLRWITTLAVATCLTLLVACTDSSNATSATGEEQASAQKFSWRIVTTWPKHYPGLGAGVDDFAERVTRMSRDRLSIKVYGAGEVIPALEVFDAVRSGAVQMGHGASYYWRGKIPAAQFFTAVPFGMTAEERNGWMYHGGGLELWREVYEPFGLVPFPMGSTGTQWAGWFNKKIRNRADFEGLVMRMPGFGGEVAAEIGAQQVQLPGGEIFTALETGTIDAAEWVGPYNDRASGFYQIAKNYYYPGWHEPGPTLELLVNKEAWMSLPEDLQAIVESAAMAASLNMHATYTAQNPLALKALIAAGTQVRPLPDALMDDLRDVSQQLTQELVDSDPTSARVHESWKAFYDQVREYRAYAEDYYVSKR